MKNEEAEAIVRQLAGMSLPLLGTAAGRDLLTRAQVWVQETDAPPARAAAIALPPPPEPEEDDKGMDIEVEPEPETHVRRLVHHVAKHVVPKHKKR